MSSNSKTSTPLVGVIMGSQSDWKTMRNAADRLESLGIACESKIMSAHRTPDRVEAYCKGARDRGLKVIIAGAGMAAALPGSAAPSRRCRFWASLWKVR